MAGEGFMQHAITSLKNNKRDRKRLFEDNSSAVYKKTEYKGSSTPKQLEEIKEKILKQERQKRFRIILAIIITIPIGLIIYIFLIMSFFEQIF